MSPKPAPTSVDQRRQFATRQKEASQSDNLVVRTGQGVVFHADVDSSNCDTLIYKWSFGPNDTSDSPVQPKKFEAAGQYQVTVQVTCGGCAKSVVSDQVVVDVNEVPPLTATFSAGPPSYLPVSPASYLPFEEDPIALTLYTATTGVRESAIVTVEIDIVEPYASVEFEFANGGLVATIQLCQSVFWNSNAHHTQNRLREYQQSVSWQPRKSRGHDGLYL